MDTIFICRTTGRIRASQFEATEEALKRLLHTDLEHLQMAGLTPTAGDARCLSFGHLVRLAVWQLRAGWRRNVPVESKLEWVKATLQQIYPLDLLPRLANQTLSSLLDADPLASMRVKEKDTLYDTG